MGFQDKPCKLDCDEMLKIIRNYVKANIDTNVADITSDYDFHFEVKKKIVLADPYNILIDTNNNLFSKRKRKPKWVNRMISHKTETIIDFKNSTSTDFGKDCVKAPSIIGENYQDLQNKGKCCPDAIANALINMYKEMKNSIFSDDIEMSNVKSKVIKKNTEDKEQSVNVKNPCPVCGEELTFEGGCNVCKACGWSKCD